MMKLWIFSSDEDIAQALENLAARIRSGEITTPHNKEVPFVMSELSDIIIETAEAEGDHN